MKEVLLDHLSSRAVGFIHFSCFCGLDIYCFGNSSKGKPPLKAIDKLRGLLDGRPAALFTTNDRPATACPRCGIELELPSAEVLAGFARRTQSMVYDQPEAN
jgi:hypothetical protein